MNFYHATDLKNAKAILAEGLKPSIDGCVHLTTNPNKALTFLAMRPHMTALAVFTVRLPKKEAQSFSDGTMSGDDCYVHSGAISPDKLMPRGAYRLTRQGGKLTADLMTLEEFHQLTG